MEWRYSLADSALQGRMKKFITAIEPSLRVLLPPKPSQCWERPEKMQRHSINYQGHCLPRGKKMENSGAEIRRLLLHNSSPKLSN